MPRRPISTEAIARVLEGRKVAEDFLAQFHGLALGFRSGDLPRDFLERLNPVVRRNLQWLLDHPRPRRSHFVAEQAFHHRQYRAMYARYGGARPYFPALERDALDSRYFKLLSPRIMAMGGDEEVSGPPPQEMLDLADLLIKDAWMIADVLPKDPPPRPAGWGAPPAGAYGAPMATLLERGPDLSLNWAAAAAGDEAWKHQATARELARMATDPGLLRGWPGDPASWAPYHAMTLLGELGAADTARDLLRTLDVVAADDWITDHLFEAGLAPMGPPVEPVLWEVIHDYRRDMDARGLGLVALTVIAKRHPGRVEAIGAEIADFLQHDPADDPGRRAVNGVAASALHGRPFDHETAWAAIRRADAAGRIDHGIFDPEELEEFGLDDG